MRLTNVTATTSGTLSGSNGRSRWCLVRVYGTHGDVSLSQDGVDITDFANITADASKAALLKVGTIDVTVNSGSPDLTVEALPEQ